MQAVEDLDRDSRIELHVGELGPFGFVVRLDRRLVFGQRQPKADERVHVTVGDVMHDLAGRPAAVAIGLIEPGAGHRGLELAREAGRWRRYSRAVCRRVGLGSNTNFPVGKRGSMTVE